MVIRLTFDGWEQRKLSVLKQLYCDKQCWCDFWATTFRVILSNALTAEATVFFCFVSKPELYLNIFIDQRFQICYYVLDTCAQLSHYFTALLHIRAHDSQVSPHLSDNLRRNAKEFVKFFFCFVFFNVTYRNTEGMRYTFNLHLLKSRLHHFICQE